MRSRPTPWARFSGPAPPMCSPGLMRRPHVFPGSSQAFAPALEPFCLPQLIGVDRHPGAAHRSLSRRQRALAAMGAGRGLGRVRLVVHAADRAVPGLRAVAGVLALRPHPAGPQRGITGLRLRCLGLDAVLGRHRHRAAVLRRLRAAGPFPAPARAAWRHRGRRPRGDGADLPALGPAWLGAVCTGRGGAGLLRLPPRPAAGAALGAVLDLR